MESAQTARLRTAIAADHDIASYQFLDHEAVYREFTNAYRDQPATLAAVLPRDLPETFRLYLRGRTAPATVQGRYQAFAGVHDAILPGASLDRPLDEAYLRWLRGTHRPGTAPPTAPLPIPGPAVDPCGNTQ